jgi:hypothetical protein
MLTESEKALHVEKRTLQRRLEEIRRLETRHPPLSDSRIAALREDRSGEAISQGGGDVDPLSTDEALSLLDEVAAWRRYKLSDEEKSALANVAAVLDVTKDAVAMAALSRIAPPKKGGA